MTQAQQTLDRVDTAHVRAGPGSPWRTPLLVALVLWGLLGLAVLGVLIFGGYDGRPVEDLSALNPLKHHAILGPVFLGWMALSALGVPRALHAITKRD